MFTDTRARSLGFTLIELLIVIAIIAILALIAVPNFLEAQVRAKTARCQADMRSLSVAIEAYAVDWGRAPLGKVEVLEEECHPGIPVVPPGVGVEAFQNLVGQSRLTTPLAYITKLMEDPFGIAPGPNTTRLDIRPFNYRTMLCPARIRDSAGTRNCAALGYTWLLKSYGPAKNASGDILAIVLNGVNSKGNSIYDASNGTLSVGVIVRTNKGHLSTPGK